MITQKDVQYIAHLSRIYVADDEAHGLAKDLEKILVYIEKLKILNVDHVQPTSHVLPIENVFREDNVSSSLGHDEVMAMVEHNDKGFFKVPQVIE
jgi:aspartyl-tRNA(Asn)/glutamyl-tRNA(Gln) amidotransferase subunit C